MNNKIEEFESKRFLIILALICILMLALVIGAFQYLPETVDNNVTKNVNIEELDESKYSGDEESNIDEETQEEQDNKSAKKELNIKLPNSGDESEKLEDIEELPTEAKEANETNEVSVSVEEKSVELTAEEKAEKVLAQGAKYKNNKQYVKAIEEFQKIPSMTKDTAMNAKSLEEIATIYAIVKRYGTALSYAQKAYNMSPSSSRETLLARLYYKTGDINNATKRINNVLQRDFALDK